MQACTSAHASAHACACVSACVARAYTAGMILNRRPAAERRCAHARTRARARERGWLAVHIYHKGVPHDGAITSVVARNNVHLSHARRTEKVAIDFFWHC